jgi:hypothetical protein
VGVACNGLGLLNRQITKADSIPAAEGLFTVNTAGIKDRGLHHQEDSGHVPKVFWEPIRCFHDLLRQKPPSVLKLYGWSSISMAFLTMWSIYMVFVASMEELWNSIRCPWSILCSAMADLSTCTSWMCC